MIKVLSLIASLITLAFLAFEYIDSQKKQNGYSNKINDYIAEEPKRISKQLLAIESQWLEAKAARLAAKNQSQMNNPDSNESVKKLIIGKEAYILYGIFSNPKQPFVLLKNESNKLIKLKLGEQLNNETTLVALQSNNIAFEQNNERIEFKLFERKK